ncbi:MAG: cysteine synthase A [Candidatus Omnitrophica bacterium]|nr:cysteine synthase A [Candidatus Omnitrophota bacterium]
MPLADRIANDVSELIGTTPLVRLNKIVGKDCAEIIAKVEYFNPGGSVKDRVCLLMIHEAEVNGLLKPGSTIIEPTSGNTGIGLAMIAAVKGYRCVLTMPETMSLERIYRKAGMQGAIKKAEELNKSIPGSYILQQFKNAANCQAHRQTTAQEILKVAGKDIDAFVAGVGTGGTITGVGEVLKEANPQIRIIAVEPETSAVLSGKKPGTHKIQGIGAGFIPEILNRKVIDEVICVSDKDAFQMSGRLAREEGLFVGIFSGAAACAAVIIGKRLGPGKRVVTIFPDTGERYFSTEQYFGI